MEQKPFDPTGQDLINELNLNMSDEDQGDSQEQVSMEASEMSDLLSEDLTEEEKKVAEKIAARQNQTDPIMEGFFHLSEKPSDEQIESWKKQHGKIYTIGLNEDEYFIFRPLRRLEWRNPLRAFAKQSDEMKI